MFRTGAQMLLLVVVVGLFLLRESQQWPGEAVDQRWADWLSINCGRRSSTEQPPVSLIAIEKQSLENHPWPWTSLDYSLFFQAALPFAPEVLGVEDILYWDEQNLPPEERQTLAQYKKILRDVLLRCPKPLLGARLGVPEDPQVMPPVQEVPMLTRVNGDIRRVREFTVVEQQPEEQFRLSARIGFTNLPETKHPSSNVPLIFLYRGQVVPTFVLQAALLWYQVSPDEVMVELGSHISLGDKVKIPINDRGEMRVNWGVPRTVFSFEDLLLTAEQAAAKTKTAIPIERIAGSVTFLGRTDEAARTVALPLQENVSTGELFTSAIGTIQTKAFVQRAPQWANWAIIGFAALLSFFVPSCRKWRVAGSALLLLLLYGGAAIYLFQRTLLWAPALLPVALAIFIVLYRAATPNWAAKPKRPVIM